MARAVIPAYDSETRLQKGFGVKHRESKDGEAARVGVMVERKQEIESFRSRGVAGFHRDSHVQHSGFSAFSPLVIAFSMLQVNDK